jgi:hypothetical protein
MSQFPSVFVDSILPFSLSRCKPPSVASFPLLCFVQFAVDLQKPLPLKRPDARRSDNVDPLQVPVLSLSHGDGSVFPQFNYSSFNRCLRWLQSGPGCAAE